MASLAGAWAGMGIGVSGFAGVAATAFFALPVTAAAPTSKAVLSVVLRLIAFSLMISLDLALRFTEEASWCTRVAGRACLFDLQQQRVAVAIDECFDQPLRVSRGLALAPQFLP